MNEYHIVIMVLLVSIISISLFEEACDHSVPSLNGDFAAVVNNNVNKTPCCFVLYPL